ncbi:YhgE/Pip [Paenibacillus yonginensis]|uniref:YhgE/Pip n=1 Tax=Paenibacillus yonginensis TaxID=1462996 RepID=A0A1B1MY66_9BACL|nr:YhgE/Pip domain-containing protein [Paenibacillus yonginensis]ANS74120.1 YhgE/Pip [Paenibacillus yonginensis]
MNKIFSLYARDIRRITGNWAAALVIGGLVLLPSLYAWFNILASWDPYGQTKGLSVAVASVDKGATVQGKSINAGNEIISSLKENHSIGWVFTTPEAALSGVKRGEFYASIEIPSDFSQRIASVLTENPQKAEIQYTVNEKINAVAPKITSQGASSIVEEVSRNFVQTANGAIFKVFNQLGAELQEQLPFIHKLTSLVLKLESRFPEINQAAKTASSDLNEAGGIVTRVQQALPQAKHLADQGLKVTSALSAFLDNSQNVIASSGPAAKSVLSQVEQTATNAAALAEMLKEANESGAVTEAVSRLEQNQTALAAVRQASESLSELLTQLKSWSLSSRGQSSAASSTLGRTADKVDQMIGKLTRLEQLNRSLLEAAKAGNALSPEELDSFAALSRETAAAAKDLLDRFEGEIQPALLGAVDNARASAKEAGDLLKDAKSTLPEVSHILTDAAQGIRLGSKELSMLSRQLPEAEQKVHELADRLRSLETEGDLQSLIDLLKLNFQKESEFFAQPVTLSEHQLFPIPNYGSAMSPFFSTLSLWVGGLLLVSLLTVEVHEPGLTYRSYEVYFGRFLTFWTLAVLQSLFVTAGDLLLLGTYAAEPVWFVVFGILLSSVFMLMIYTLVSVFGNVGKAMAIVLLVLQLAGSGGTFPIQVTPPFFQAVYPFLPFTYAIRMMREAVGGILWDIVGSSALMLLLFAASALAIGIGLKEIINSVSSNFVKKAKRSKLIH